MACSGQVVPIGELDQASSKGDSSTSVAPPSGSGSSEIPACAEPSGDVDQYTSIADTAARISGIWFLCSGGISSPADTTGIELSDTKAYFLVTSGNTLARGSGPDHERDVSFVDTTAMNGPGHYQINLSTESGTNMYFSRTSVDGRFLELNEGTSGRRARYVRAKAAPPSCATPTGSPHVYTSIEDVRARIAGKWRVCSGAITSPDDTKGLELAGTKAYFLFDSAAGLTRRDGWDYERDVAIIDTTSMNGPGSYQVNLSTGGGTNMYFSRVSESGDKLELDEGTSGKKVVYVRVP